MASRTTEEKTFRSYSTGDAAQYAQSRMQYSQALYDSILDYHKSGGAKLDTVVDLGCGPGLATFKLAEYFTNVIGLDPSEGMIATARARLESEPSTENHSIKFEVSTAEDIDPALIPDASVDLITAATCAHWFDMTRFWPSAARILKPGGTVALWCARKASAHPSVPNAAAINDALQELEDTELVPYFEPGNLLTRGLYADIGLPWTVDPPVPSLDEASFAKELFGSDAGEARTFLETEEAAGREYDLVTIERMLGTMSPVTRWRQAHPEAVGTEDDVVRRMIRVIEKYLHEAGVKKGEERLRGGSVGILMMVKKRA